MEQETNPECSCKKETYKSFTLILFTFLVTKITYDELFRIFNGKI